MEEPLDANYALLSDVSARNRALQARLRSSLPLLWTDNALVMTSAAPRRRRQQTEQSTTGEADQMLLALEGGASLQVSRRYKRRVEWEVARRIARVDRELQQYPPAQRFWNQKRKDTTPPASTYRQRNNKGLGRDQRGGRGGGELERENGGKTPPERMTRKELTTKTRDSQRERSVWTKPQMTTTTRDERKEFIHMATSPLHATDDKENTKPNVAPRARSEASDEEQSHFGKQPSTRQQPNNEFRDDVERNDDVTKEEKPESPMDLSESIRNMILSSLDDAIPVDSSAVRSSPAKGTKVAESATSKQQGDDAEDLSVVDDLSPRRKQTERLSTSLGRQVLSEFRTMPSVASFGAQPVLSVGNFGNPGDKRLNADVLRRLFSDLDTDKDGHVNRVEMCIALHRLQISVPSTKIISFFRHIHSSSGGKGVRSRKSQHFPMKEVINYKEFLAFVTAAYDQQQQQKVQRNAFAAQQRNKESPPPLSVPSTSLPIFSQPNNSLVTKRASTPQPQLTDQQVKLYEVDDVGLEEEAAVFEERMMKEIPDLLVNRLLTDVPERASVENREAAVSVVRRSLESLVGKDAVDGQVVCEIAQELIKERLRNIGALSQDEWEDVTGLKRAAAYYSEQMQQNNLEINSIAEDSISGDLVNWADILTEEQVSSLVQQIWKDRQVNLRQAHLETAEVMSIESVADALEDHTVKWIDEATDTNELSSTADIQTSEVTPMISPEIEAAIISDEKHENAAVSPPEILTNSQPERCFQTHFARAFELSLADGRKSFGVVTSIQLLQRLRQERRKHHTSFNHQCRQALSKESEALNSNQGPRPSIRDDKYNLTKLTCESVEDECKSFDSHSEKMEQTRNETKKRVIALPLTAIDPLPLTEKMLDVSNAASSESSVEIARRSVSEIRSSISSTSDYQLEPTIHLFRTTLIHRQRPQRHRRRSSVSGSSVPDSICSADLSEGEVSRQEALDLSDGEIFGDSKRIYKANKHPTQINDTADSGSLLSSVESGELPALMKAHANFRQQVLAQSSSSVESGEVEDGVVSG